MYNDTELPTIHNLQAGGFESDMCKDKDYSVRTFAKRRAYANITKNI